MSTSSSSYKCMVVLPKEEYDKMKNDRQAGVHATLGSDARDNNVTNVTNEGGVILVNTSPDDGKKTDENSAGNGEKLSKKEGTTKKEQGGTGLDGGKVGKNDGERSGKVQTGRYARIKSKGMAVNRSTRTNTSDDSSKNEVSKSASEEKVSKVEEAPVLNEYGRPVIKGKRQIFTLKRKRNDIMQEEDLIDRKRQRESFLQNVIEDKLAKLQGRTPPSPFVRGSVTSRPIARVLQAPIFKPEPLQPMEVDEQVNKVYPVNNDEIQPMDEDVADEPRNNVENEKVDYPLQVWRRGYKRTNFASDDVEDKPAEKRRWLGDRSHGDRVGDAITYPDDGEEQGYLEREDIPQLEYDEKDYLTSKRGVKRVMYDEEDAIRSSPKRLTYRPTRDDAPRSVSAVKRKAITYEEKSKKARPSFKRKREEDDEEGLERKRMRRQGEKRKYPFKDENARKRRYVEDNDYELW